MKFKRSTYFVFAILLLFFLFYLVQPLNEFPDPPVPSLQSNEPADVESSFRRSYFLNHDRKSIMEHYSKELSYMPLINLNYPPEEAQTIIRDQTRSSYLEELVQPFRASLYINGFVPNEEKDRILIDNQHFEQKITVRYVPTTLLARLIFFSAVSISTYLLISMSFSFFSNAKNIWQKKLI